MNWNDYVYYKEGKLYWKGTNKYGPKKDTVAGCFKQDGYRDVRCFNTVEKEHRIVWKLHFGEIPEGLVIDHINNNRSDNRIENLRLVTPLQNSWNRLKHKTNTSGFNNVHYDSKRCKYRCSLRVNGKRYRGSYKDTAKDSYEEFLELNEKFRNTFLA